MTNNLALWDMHSDIDPKHTKAITGKQYKGTSPSPQHVVWCLTDMFGPIGSGWGAHVVAEGFQPLGDEILHWCRVEFWHGNRGNTFQTYGQTKALMKTKNGLMSDEDAPKKSFTDALVKAASYVGVAANIFLGRWDDAKYVQELAKKFEGAASDTEIEAAITAISALTSLDALVGYWTELNKKARHVAADPRVIKEKDAKKAELENNQ